MVGAPYSHPFQAVGTGVITYSATGLPDWLHLNGSTGVVSGTPRERTSKHSFRFVAMVTDHWGAQTPILFSLPYAGKAKTARR